MTRLIALWFFMFLGLHAYVHDGWGLLQEEPGLTLVATDYEPTFHDQVGEWAEELTDTIPSPESVNGNCLPVAMELQRRIVETGRSALIVLVELVDNESNHAMVMYTEEPNGRFTHVIDNGFATAWVSQPRALLNKGHLGGPYYATCKTPNAVEATCEEFGLPF